MIRYILPIVILIALSTTANAHTFRDRLRARFSRPTVEAHGVSLRDMAKGLEAVK